MELIRRGNKPRIPKPPNYLSDTMQHWWKTVLKNWELESHHIRLLETACSAWDRAEQARVAIASEGLTISDAKGNTRANPLCSVELQSRKLFTATLRELGLDVRAPEPARAPLLPSYYRKAGGS